MSNQEQVASNSLQGKKEKTALTYGHFSTIHTGHIRYLKKAKEKAEKVITALIGDKGENRYAFTQEERAEALETVGIVDEVIRLEGNELDDREETRYSTSRKRISRRECHKRLQVQAAHGGEVEFTAGM